MKKRLIILLLPVFFVSVVVLSIQKTQAYFSHQVMSSENIFSTAEAFPDLSPTVSPTPGESDDLGSCGDIDVDVSGNGVGSHNGVIIVCRNNEVVWQTNRVDVRNEIDVETNTGNNTSDGNTNSTTVVQSGTSSSSATIENTSESNTTVTGE